MIKNCKIIILLIGILFILDGVFALSLSQDLKVYVNPDLVLNSPVQDVIYIHRNVPVNITQNFNSNIFYKDFRGNYFKICRNCYELGYNKKKILPFDDGFHQVVFTSKFGSTDVYEFVNFTVDTHKPLIRKAYSSGKFSDGRFTVEFDEENPILINLSYQNKFYSESKEINISNCYSIKRSRTTCNIEINLTKYDTSEIFYQFKIIDILGRSGESKLNKIKVDFTPPKVIEFNHSRTRNKVSFFFKIDEPNFKSVTYIDTNERNPVTRLLCQSLKNNECKKTKSFSTGAHSLNIQIIDQAGNVNEIKNVII